MFKRIKKAVRCTKEKEEIIISDEDLKKRPSLYIFKPDNIIRKYIVKKVSSRNFEILMFLMIIISSV